MNKTVKMILQAFGLDQYLRIIRKHYHEKPNE